MQTQKTSPIAILVLLASLSAPFRSQEDGMLRAFVKENERRVAYGIFLGNEKVGWMIEEMKLGRDGGREVAAYRCDLRTSYEIDGQLNTTETSERMVYALSGEGQIVSATTHTVEDGVPSGTTVRREGDGLKVTSISRGGVTVRQTSIPKDSLARTLDFDRWRRNSPAVGATFLDYSAEWQESDVDAPELVTFRGTKPGDGRGAAGGVQMFEVKTHGAVMKLECRAQDGVMIRGRIGPLEFRLEPEAEAVRETNAPAASLSKAIDLAVDVDLGDPEAVKSLVVEITHLDGFTMPASDRQHVSAAKDGTVIVEISRDSRTAAPCPLPAAERASHVASTPVISSADPKVRELALGIAGGETDPEKAAMQIQRWVFEKVEQTAGASAPTALDVLASRQGDCTECSLLFVALARALDIPAKMVTGIAFTGAEAPRFGWHSWAEVHDGDRWITVDPTWRQLDVDATHIKFSESDEDQSWLNVLGRIEMKVVRFERDDSLPALLERLRATLEKLEKLEAGLEAAERKGEPISPSE